jgi:hypothetical protein
MNQKLMVSNYLMFLFGRYKFRFSTLTESILRLHGSCFQCLQTNYRIAPVPKTDLHTSQFDIVQWIHLEELQ